MHPVFDLCLPWSGGYRHYNSHLEDFYEGFAGTRVASVNNRALDLPRLGDVRLSRFVRDPRDLLVSGYFYHRRGAEDWVNIEGPTEEDWYFANADVPRALQEHGGSLAQYLQEVSLEEGLLAELEMRAPHLESMLGWPEDDHRILTMRYEDVIHDPVAAFDRIFEHYGLSPLETRLARFFARRHARPRTRDSHVRDPTPGQWREHFSERILREFDSRFPTLIEALGYPVD